jgi:hypothetical protein
MFTGPNISTDGLVLALDSTSQKSYPGSGTTWYDLSGNGYDFELINSPSIVDGYFDFSTNEYATLIITGSSVEISDLLPEYSSFTVEVSYKFVETGSRGKFIGTGNYGRGGWNLGVGYSNFNQISFEAYNGECIDGVNCQYNRGSCASSYSNSTDKFNFYQVSYDYENTTTSLYINGRLIKSQFYSTYGTGKNPQGVGNTASFRIGANMQGGWLSKKGLVGLVRFYKRALTSTELEYNFNSYKKRFNL